jgi:hypothetical protein
MILKLLLIAMLCIPLAYLAVMLLGFLMDEAINKNKKDENDK